jgi:hypothetical protein
MTQMTYAGSELQDGGSYYLRVRVSNGTLWSDWTEGDFRMNSVPSPATDLSPSGMTGVTSDNPTLSHTNAVDAENDQLVYAYEVYADPELSTLLDQVSGHPSGAGSTSWTVTVPLNDNSVYYWRVRGDDPYEEGLWADAVSFWVNSVNDLPASFSLLSPTDGEKIPGRTVSFTWEASSDADPYDQIEYTLHYSTDPSFASKTVISELDSTSYAPPVYLEYGTTYYWRVMAQDMFSGQTYCQSDFSFTTISRGDANGDGMINVADAVFIINYIFNDGPPPDPIESGDANCDTGANVGDAVYLISYIFNGGPEPGCH